MSTYKSATILADTISGMLNTAPDNFNDDEDVDETLAQTHFQREYCNENENVENVSSYNLSKAHVDLADIDERYAGKKTNRNCIDQFEKDADFIGDVSDGSVSSSDYDKNDGSSIDTDADSDSEAESNNVKYSSDLNRFNDENFKIVEDVKDSQHVQVEKGLCVRNQIGIWENLLEIRIQLQKCLMSANRMPQHDSLDKIVQLSDSDFTNCLQDTRKNVTCVLNKLIDLQNICFKQYLKTINDIDDPSNSNEQDDEKLNEIDYEKSNELELKNVSKCEEKPVVNKINTLEEKLHDTFQNLKSHSLKVIQKWNNKTRISSFDKNSSKSNSVNKQIEFALSDKSKLIKKTKVKKSRYNVLFKNNDDISDNMEEYDAEIFDDSDFYHELLRYYIEFKSSGVTDSVELSRQWIRLQNLRSKMKRKIDTKATKGRKIRYAVHSKLVNFMAPVEYNNIWTEDAKTELYTSLFSNLRDKNKLIHGT